MKAYCARAAMKNNTLGVGHGADAALNNTELTTKEITFLSRYGLLDDSIHSNTLCSREQELRVRFIFVLTKQLACRWDDLAHMMLCDLHMKEILGETGGGQKCYLFQITSVGGKGKSHDSVLRVLMRHKDPTLCGIFAIACHLFNFITVHKELTFEHFQNGSWLAAPLLPNKFTVDSLKSTLSDKEKLDMQHKERTKMYNMDRTKVLQSYELSSPPIQSTKCLHLGRKQSSIEMVGAGLANKDIDNHLKHTTELSMQKKAYSVGYEITGVRVSAGHSATQGNAYINRNANNPSDELIKQVFPILTQLEAYVLENANNAAFGKHIPAFTKCLRFLAIVLLQDFAFLSKSGLNRHPFMNQTLFSSGPFKIFIDKLFLNMKAEEDDAVEKLTNSAVLNQAGNELVTSFIHVHNKLDSIIEAGERRHEQMMALYGSRPPNYM